MALATGQITIVDFNDINPSATAPSNPVLDQLWLDSSVVPNVLRRWDGASWISTGLNLSDVPTSNNRTFKVRYIRDWLNGSNINSGNHWVEIKAMAGNTNRASGKTAELYNSSNVLQTWNATYPGSRVTDGDTTSANYAMGTTSSGLQYVKIDLGAIYEDINYLHIWHVYADGRKYHNTKTEISEDGTTWYVLADAVATGEYSEPATGDGKVVLVNGNAIIQYASDKIYKWLKSGTTYIDGGQIAADTILTQSLSVGTRGVQFSGFSITCNTPIANRLYWSTGSVIWISDTGVLTTSAVTSSASDWTSGTLYLYWTKTSPTTLSATTTQSTAYARDNVIVATYTGGTGLTVLYGKTIVDGTAISTGTLSADKLKTSSLSASTEITVGGLSLDSGSGSNNGSIRLGQLSWNNGTGFWLGQVGGVPKFSIGNSSGNRITWDTSTGILTVVAAINLAAGSTGWGNLADKPADEALLNPFVAITNDAELFSYTSNLTGSRGSAPTGSVSTFTRVDDGGKFGYDCISLGATDKLVYNTLNAGINFDKFSILCWVKRQSVAATAGMLMGTWPYNCFGFDSTSKLVFMYTNTTQQTVTSTLTIADTNWHLIGIAVDKANNKVTFFKDNTYEDKTATIGYTAIANPYTVGQKSYIDTTSPINSLIDNMVIFKNSIITSQFAKTAYDNSKPFLDQNPKFIPQAPSNPVMTIIEDYTETEYAIDGYTYLIG